MGIKFDFKGVLTDIAKRNKMAKFDLVTIKNEVDSGELDVPGFVRLIDNKMVSLNHDVEQAKKLVDTARQTEGDFCGLGSKGRVTALADALTKTNETISATHELIRGVIGLILCSATFAARLIQSSAELFGGQMKDANGRIVKVSAQTEEFIRSVVEIAKGVMTTQTELKQEVTDAKSALEVTFRSQVDQMLAGLKRMEHMYAQKAGEILEDARNVARRQDEAIGANKDAIKKSEEKNAEQDRLLLENAKVDEAQNVEIKRQAKKDAELDEKTEMNKKRIANNAKEIEKNARMISELEERLKIQRRSIAQAKMGLGTGKVSIVVSVIALLTAVAAVVLTLRGF